MENTNSSYVSICEICQISYGFSSEEKRSIIVMVVFCGLALISCYVGVLWYAFLARYISNDIVETIHINGAFHHDDIQNEDQGKSNLNEIEKPAIIQMENEARF